MRIRTVSKSPPEFAFAASGFGVADWYVVRGYEGTVIDPGAVIFPSLEETHDYCRALNLVCFNPAPDALPEVIEVWAPPSTDWPHGRKEVD